MMVVPLDPYRALFLVMVVVIAVYLMRKILKTEEKENGEEEDSV